MASVRKSLDEILATPPDLDRAKVEATTQEQIRAHAIEDGQDPDAPLDRFQLAVPPKAVREKLGMSQREFAAALNIPLATLRNWEQGRVALDPAVRALLTIVYRNPAAALAALAA